MLLLLALAGSALAADPKVPEAVAAADLVQRELPALRARQEAALARVEAAATFFAGRSELGAAFPDLAETPLLDPVFGRHHPSVGAGAPSPMV